MKECLILTALRCFCALLPHATLSVTDKNDTFWILMRYLIGQKEADISRKYIERFLDFEKNCCQDVKGHDNVSWHLIINI